MAWAWAVIILFFVVLAAVGFIAIKILVNFEKNRKASEAPEYVLGEFGYSEKEWELVHRQCFVEDTRGQSLLDPYSGIISSVEGGMASSSRGVRFSDQNIYLFGDGKQKMYKVQRPNPGGSSVLLRSMSILNLEPMKKLRVQISLSQRLDMDRVDHDLDYLIPVPRSALDSLPMLEREYGELILHAA